VSKPMGSDSAYVVTNFHVIDGCGSGLRVIRYPVYPPVNAFIHARDPSNDLALLSTKLPAGGFQGILGTLRAAEALGGAIPQNVNFGITATTIIGFLQAHSVDYRLDTERTKFEPEQIAEEAKKFTVKITCGDQ
jgi:hypothetical protein